MTSSFMKCVNRIMQNISSR